MSDATASDMHACPPEDTLEAIAGGFEAPDAVRRHVASCDSCRRTLAELGEAITVLDAALGSELDPSRAADTRIPGYRLTREIHRGGQGVVWLAEQVGTSRTVAIKMLLLGVAATTEQRRRFEREVEAIASMRDPAIVTIFEQGVTTDGVPYYAMEYVEGRRFDEWLEADTPSLGMAVSMIARIAEAVGTAHRHGIIHRDLKPGNILIDHEGLPRVLDFGLARLETERDFDATVTQETRDGAFLGNFAYASPEQLSGSPHAVDTSSDVYALGLLLYEAIAGCRAFPTPDSIATLVGQRVGRTPPKPSSVARGIGHELDLIVLKALDSEPQRRYATAVDFAADLRRYLDGLPVLARGDAAAYVLWKAARRNIVATSIAAGSLAVILLALVLLWLENRESERRLTRAEAVADVYHSAFEFVDPQGKGTIDLRAPDLIARLEGTARTSLEGEPIDQGRMLLLSGESFCNLEHVDDAERCYRDVILLADRIDGRESNELRAEARHGLGRVEYFRGVDADRRAAAARQRGRWEAAAMERAAAEGHLADAIAHYDAAVSLFAADSVASPATLARSLQHRAATRVSLEKVDGRIPDLAAIRDAESSLLEVERLIGELDPSDDELHAGTWNAIAAAREAMGDPDGAIEAARRAADLVDLDASSAWAGRAQATLGTRLLRAGRAEEAIDPLSRGVAICRTVYGDESLITRRYWHRWILAQLRSGRHEDAMATIAGFESICTDDDHDADRRRLALAGIDARVGLGRLDEARGLVDAWGSGGPDGRFDQEVEIRRFLLGDPDAGRPTAEEQAEILSRWGTTAVEAAD
jgi:tetratricopeptide (TPR) repeat protein/predicted Ser/Thr protein kinase